jgi:hypothetical protein
LDDGIVVTDKRVLVKFHWIAIKTREMNLTKVESVDVKRSILEWLLDAGDITVRGTGGTWEPLGPIAAPIKVRNAITVG